MRALYTSRNGDLHGDMAVVSALLGTRSARHCQAEWIELPGERLGGLGLNVGIPKDVKDGERLEPSPQLGERQSCFDVLLTEYTRLMMAGTEGQRGVRDGPARERVSPPGKGQDRLRPRVQRRSEDQ